jgi:hypothetical protein
LSCWVSVLSPLNISQIGEELEGAKFISVMTESSLLCSIARSKNENSQAHKLSGESSVQLTECIVSVFEEFKLIDTVVLLSADNTGANFGEAKRRGKNNVFERLRNKIKRVIVVGCVVHVVAYTVPCRQQQTINRWTQRELLARYGSISTFILCIFNH